MLGVLHSKQVKQVSKRIRAPLGSFMTRVALVDELEALQGMLRRASESE